jgi:hypothetical protein
MTTVDVATCPGPDGRPIPLLHFDDVKGSSKLAVSLSPDGRAVFSTPRAPLDFYINPIMLSVADRRELGRRLLEGLPDE